MNDREESFPDKATLEFFIDQALKHCRTENPPWTIGIEHEFFLELNGLPVPLEQSQTFFHHMVAQGWQVKQRDDSGRGAVLALSPPYSPQTVLKYEHYPFMLKVAFHFDTSLVRLEILVTVAFKELALAAEFAGVEVCHRPFCSVAAAILWR